MAAADVICDLCREPILIYAIGLCDHPVCHVCATRMRILCKQNYCSICRTDLEEMIFARESEKYSRLNGVRDELLTNKLYPGFKFQDRNIRREFESLLEHQCHLCEEQPVKNFTALKIHYNRTHSLFFCDLCVGHLHLFSYERKVYDRKELARHRREGDADDRSHRGHPLCEFCDERYVDNDELMKHLRTQHFFCHFCDNDGVTNQYYETYPDLKDHFKSSHYLCEEGECANVQFTNSFRSDIDLKAHLVNAHKDAYKTKGKLKRDLQIELEFNQQPRIPSLARGRGRGRGDDYPVGRGRGRGRDREGQGSPRTVGVRSGDGDNDCDSLSASNSTSIRNSPQPERALVLSDVSSFPSLDNSKPITAAPAPVKTDISESKEDSDTYYVFSDVAPKPLKSKEVSTTSKSSTSKAGFKPSSSFRSVWNNEMSQINNEEQFPTLGESFQPKPKKLEPTPEPEAKTSSGWTMVDDDEDSHPWSLPQQTQLAKEVAGKTQKDGRPTPAQKENSSSGGANDKSEPNGGARPKKVKDVGSQPKKSVEDFPSLGGVASIKGKTPLQGSGGPALSFNRVISTAGYATPSNAKTKKPAGENSRVSSATVRTQPASSAGKEAKADKTDKPKSRPHVARDEDESDVPAWVSITAPGSNSKSAGKTMSVPLSDSSSTSPARSSNVKMIQAVAPESSGRSSNPANINLRAERDFPSLGAAPKVPDVSSLNDLASMFATKAKKSSQEKDKKEQDFKARQKPALSVEVKKDIRSEGKQKETEKPSKKEKPTENSGNNINAKPSKEKTDFKKEEAKSKKDEKKEVKKEIKKEEKKEVKKEAKKDEKKEVRIEKKDDKKEVRHEKIEENKEEKNKSKEEKKEKKEDIIKESKKQGKSRENISQSMEKKSDEKQLETSTFDYSIKEGKPEKPDSIDENSFPALQSKKAKKNDKTEKTEMSSEQEGKENLSAAKVVSNLMDWWDVDSHKQKEQVTPSDTSPQDITLSLDSTSDFPSFHNNKTKTNKRKTVQPDVKTELKETKQEPAKKSNSQLTLATLLSSMSAPESQTPSNGGKAPKAPPGFSLPSAVEKSSHSDPIALPIPPSAVRKPPGFGPPGFGPATSGPPASGPPASGPLTSAPLARSGSATPVSAPPASKTPPGFDVHRSSPTLSSLSSFGHVILKTEPETDSWNALDVTDSWQNTSNDNFSNYVNTNLNNNKKSRESHKTQEIGTDYPYKEPAEFGKRNASLLSAVDAALTPKDKIEFLKLSTDFRSGSLSAGDYFRKSSSLFSANGGHITTLRVFSELIALLPDIHMQVELNAAFQRYMPPGFWGKAGLKSCPTCGQVLNSHIDFIPHVASHNLTSILKSTGQDQDTNFPSLQSAVGIR